MLTDPSFRDRARALQGQMAAYVAVAAVADTLEELAGGESFSGADD